MFALNLTAEWRAWVIALSAPLHGRLAWRLPAVVAGIVFASGRRTASSWWRAARVGNRFRSYHYFLDSVGRETQAVAAILLKIVTERVDAGGRLVFALDDAPTKRYGPKVQGAGIHHNPTPGPAGSKFLHGHSWVTLSRVAHHARCGVIGLPLLGMLYVRKVDVPGLPAGAGIRFGTELEMAAGAVAWLRGQLPSDAVPAWVVVDGGYAKREFLKPAKRAGFVVVARLRKDAALCGLPPAAPPGRERGRGRPPSYGKNHLSLAERAGQTRGWQELTVKATTGRAAIRRYKTFLATWRPAGGPVRVVILKGDDGPWRAFLCTDAEASVEAIVQAIHDRWSIDIDHPDYHPSEWVSASLVAGYDRHPSAADPRPVVPSAARAA